MKRLLVVVVLLVAVIVGLGFYLDWFRISTGSTDDKTGINVTVDQKKIREGTKKAKEKVKEFGRKATEGNGRPADQTKETTGNP
jgi:hypothetical protein